MRPDAHVSYLLPVFLSLIVVWFTGSADCAHACLMRLPWPDRSVITEVIILDQDDIRWLSFRHNDQIFHYNRWQMMPEAGNDIGCVSPHTVCLSWGWRKL
jgi:hypothetical protein